MQTINDWINDIAEAWCQLKIKGSGLNLKNTKKPTVSSQTKSENASIHAKMLDKKWLDNSATVVGVDILTEECRDFDYENKLSTPYCYKGEFQISDTYRNSLTEELELEVNASLTLSADALFMKAEGSISTKLRDAIKTETAEEHTKTNTIPFEAPVLPYSRGTIHIEPKIKKIKRAFELNFTLSGAIIFVFEQRVKYHLEDTNPFKKESLLHGSHEVSIKLYDIFSEAIKNNNIKEKYLKDVNIAFDGEEVVITKLRCSRIYKIPCLSQSLDKPTAIPGFEDQYEEKLREQNEDLKHVNGREIIYRPQHQASGLTVWAPLDELREDYDNSTSDSQNPDLFVHFLGDVINEIATSSGFEKAHNKAIQDASDQQSTMHKQSKQIIKASKPGDKVDISYSTSSAGGVFSLSKRGLPPRQDPSTKPDDEQNKEVVRPK